MAGVAGEIQIIRTFRLGNLLLDVGIDENIPNFGRGLILFIRRNSEPDTNRKAISRAYYVSDSEDEQVNRMVEAIEEHLRLPDMIMCPQGIKKGEYWIFWNTQKKNWMKSCKERKNGNS